MYRNRLIYSLFAVVLLALTALTIRSSLATSTDVSTAAVMSSGSAHPPGLENSVQAPDPAGYWTRVTFAPHGLTQAPVRPPETYGSPTYDPAGYWNDVTFAPHGLTRPAVRPPELYNPIQVRDLAG
jgi:hypothetical protein